MIRTENQAVGSAAIPSLLNVTRSLNRVQQSSRNTMNNSLPLLPAPESVLDMTRVTFAVFFFSFGYDYDFFPQLFSALLLESNPPLRFFLKQSTKPFLMELLAAGYSESCAEPVVVNLK